MSGPRDPMSRADAVKARLDFSDAAEALDLNPIVIGRCEGVRCDCPDCGQARGVVIRKDEKGGRCTNTHCQRGYSVISLAMAARSLEFAPAVTLLEALIARTESGGEGQPDLLAFASPHPSTPRGE